MGSSDGLRAKLGAGPVHGCFLHFQNFLHSRHKIRMKKYILLDLCKLMAADALSTTRFSGFSGCTSSKCFRILPMNVENSEDTSFSSDCHAEKDVTKNSREEERFLCLGESVSGNNGRVLEKKGVIKCQSVTKMDKGLPDFGNVMGRKPLSLIESQLAMQITRQQDHCSHHSFHPQQVPDLFYFGVGSLQQLDQQPFQLLDGNLDEGLDNFGGNYQWINGLVGHNGTIDGGTRRREPLWQRMKWTDEMVKLLLTALSYVGEDALFDFSNSEKISRFPCPIKGKWRAISNCMCQRGYMVSPQQCEDKFNDLNKKYKRLNDVLGGTNLCDVVENPALLESMDIQDEAKEEVKRILSCKQLFYQEMFSYHNRNWKYLPHDEALKLSLRSALKGKTKIASRNLIQEMPAKKQKQGEDWGIVVLPDTCSPAEPENLVSVLSKDVKGQRDHNQLISRLLQLEEKKLQIHNEMIELEKKKFEWLKSYQKQGRELHELKLENELLKLENKRLELELKIREISAYRN